MLNAIGEMVPKVHKLALMENSKLMDAGLPSEGLAVPHDKVFADFFSEAQHVLAEFVGDVAAEVVFHHDPDWKVFPEVSRALKRSGAIEDCYTVAVCRSKGVWAVGIASGWKPRESATKLALCLALAEACPELKVLGKKYSEFIRLIDPGAKVNVPAPAVRRPTPRVPQAAPQPTAQSQLRGQTNANSINGARSAFWILLMDRNTSIVREGLPSDGPVVIHGKESFQDLFAQAQIILNELVRVASDVKMQHDADWNIFPEVGRAIAKTCGEEHCFCVASCRSKGVWAVGVAPGWKHREAVAKIALCVALVANSPRTLDRLVPKFPAFGVLCEEAGMLPASAAKRQRGAA